MVLFEYAVVSQPTVAEASETDRTSQLPGSLRHTHEWDRFSVEIWVHTDSETPVDIQDLTLDLRYRTDITSAVDVQFGQSFEGDSSYLIQETDGEVHQLSASTAGLALTNQDRVLFARIHFETIPENGDNVRLDYATGSVGPHNLELAASNLAARFAGQSLEVAQAAMPQAGLLPVLYDLDDDHRIGLGDFARFVAQFGEDGSSPDDTGAWFADFDKVGRVGLQDFAYFVQNFGRDYQSQDIILPDNYPEAWKLPGAEGDYDPVVVIDIDDPEDEPQDTPPPRFQLMELHTTPPHLSLPGTGEVFQLLIGVVAFHGNLQIDRLSANASYSGNSEDEEAPGDVVLTLVLEDDELYQTEIEVLFNGELIDTLAEYEAFSGILTSYVGEVLGSLQSMLEEMLSDD